MLPQMMPMPWLGVFFMIFSCLFSLTFLVSLFLSPKMVFSWNTLVQGVKLPW